MCNQAERGASGQEKVGDCFSKGKKIILRFFCQDSQGME